MRAATADSLVSAIGRSVIDRRGVNNSWVGDELAAIIAFIHDEEEQKLFSEADIPDNVKKIMHEAEDEYEGREEGHVDGG